MARVDVKGLTKRREALRTAALELAKKKRSPSGKPHPDEGHYMQALERAAFDFVAACVTGCDGKNAIPQLVEPNLYDHASKGNWLTALQTNPENFAAAIGSMKKEPYARIFAFAQWSGAAQYQSRRLRGEPTRRPKDRRAKP